MELDELQKFRRFLHKHPEVSGKEEKTQKAILEKLGELENVNVKKLGGTGLRVHFKFEGGGPKILIRADIDALPIKEINDFEHRSTMEGVSHKCGHDGHTAILLGLAFLLDQDSYNKGEVLLIFQPAEENGEGAKAILEDEEFNYEADYVFALHNLPGYPLHQIVCKPGIFTAAASSCILKFEGKTSHAAEPEKGINPAFAIAEILHEISSLSIPDIKKDDFRLISVIFMQLGEKAYGISAGQGELHLTLRSWNNEVMQDLKAQIIKMANEKAARHNLQLQIEWLQEFFANENESECFEIIRRVAADEKLKFEQRAQPFKWGEDFGLYTSRFKGAMFGIGAGEDSPALHNPDYDFPDEIIKTGIQMFNGIIKNILSERHQLHRT